MRLRNELREIPKKTVLSGNIKKCFSKERSKNSIKQIVASIKLKSLPPKEFYA
jgi:hypothetical protein